MSFQHFSWRWVIALSILAALLTLGLKTTAWYYTNSVGLLSDALESGINLLAAFVTALSLSYASRPADPTHTYGHEKIEYFSSGLEGMLVLLAGGSIIWYAIKRMILEVPLEQLGLGTLLALIASSINLVVAMILIRVGRKHRSIALEADGHHLMTDVWTSVGVVVAFGVVWLTGWAFFDPIIALLVGLNILWTGYNLIRRAVNGLMDHAIPIEQQEQLRTLISGAIKPGMDYHALRTRQSGTRLFADFHLLVPGRMSVLEAHTIADQIETTVETAMPGLELTIHIEPIEETSSWDDSDILKFEGKPSSPEQ